MVATQVDLRLTDLAAITEELNPADTLRRPILDTVNHRMANLHKMTRRLTESPRPHMANLRRHHTCNHLAIHRLHRHRHPINRLPHTPRHNRRISPIARRHTRHQHKHRMVVDTAINNSILLRVIHQLHLQTVVHRRTKRLLLTKCTKACFSHLKYFCCC